jgi:hypothetical protein
MSPGLSTNSSFGLKLARIFSGRPSTRLRSLLRADLPAALSLRLQQEHVVGVEVRTDAAAVGGEADHQVVQAGIGDEAELAQQRVGLGVEQVDALDQHGPALLRHRRQAFQRAVLHIPFAVDRGDQARFGVVGGGQLGQRLHAQQRFEAGDGVTDQQWLLVPVVAQELRRRDVAEER